MIRIILFSIISLGIISESFGQCTAGNSNEFKNLGSTVNLSDYINCPGGDVVLNTVGSDAGGNGIIIFDLNFNFNSITINFQSGNKPAQFVVPSGITVTITTDMTFTGAPNKDKFLTVEGTLIVGGELDFGEIPFEIDGTGSIDAGTIVGADNSSCTNGVNGGSGTCPTITAGSCDDGGGGFCGDPALPISLVSFDAKTTGQSVELIWVTASEENNDYFTLERSKDGINYMAVGVIPGAGNSIAKIEYTYLDINPYFGQSYYRLKQTDFNGASETFGPISIEYTSLIEGRLLLTTNPVNKGDKVRIVTSVNTDEMLTITVHSMLGEVIMTDQFRNSNYEFSLNNNLKSGMYFITVNSINSKEIARLVVR